MASNNEIMLDKISKVLKGAHKDGIEYLFTASYLMGIPKNLDREDLKNLSKHMLKNNITVQQVYKFVNQNNIDIFGLLEQLQQDDEQTVGIDIGGEVMEENNVEEVEKVEQDFVEEVGENQEEITENVSEQEEEKIQLTEKAKKLQEKINLLCDKVEQEKSPLKKHMLTFKIKMLTSKIQKEIDIQNIQAKYNEKRELASWSKQNKEEKLLNQIAGLQTDIDYITRYIKGNEQYDYESDNFLYPKEFVESRGGIQEFSENLKQSDKQATQRVAGKIEKVASAREELNALNEQLKEEQKKLSKFDVNYDKHINFLNRKEKALIKQEKGNIFSRMGNFFGTMADEAKLYWKERQELNETIKAHKQEMKEFKMAQKEELRLLKEGQVAERKDLKAVQKDEVQEQISNQAKDTAAAFRTSQVVPPEAMIEESSTQQTDEPALEVDQEPVVQEDNGQEL